MSGILYLVATPIGNLEDMTIRGIRILKEVDLIAAEDTRNSIKLLNHFEISTPMTSYHEHNKFEKGEELAMQLLEGKTIALISDAGTPGISDPGEELVKICYGYNIKVVPIPGACAAINALIVSGLATKRFIFEGFLPTDKKKKKIVLEEISRQTGTIVLYEAPHRLLKTLDLLIEYLGDRKATLCREITKKYETIMPSTLLDLKEYYLVNQIKGVCVIVIQGLSFEMIEKEKQDKWEKLSVLEHIEYYINQGEDKKIAIKKVAVDRGVSKREIYEYTKKDMDS